MTTSRRRQADERREQILAAALTLFGEQGFHSTTIADVARATGTAHGLVYHYFDSKQHLLEGIIERYGFLPRLGEQLSVSGDRPAFEVLSEIATGFSAMLAERRDLLLLVIRESQTNPAVADALDRMMAEADELLIGYIESRIAAGELRPHDPSVPTRALFWSIVTKHLVGDETVGMESELVEVLLDGIRAP